jgi:hypothetical protein
MNFFQARLQSFTDWLGRVIECIKEFYRPLEDLRIIFLSLLAGGYVLLYLDQGRDVIRGLVDSANAVVGSWPPQGDWLRIIWRWAAFMLACVWSGINAWYWANLMYKTSGKGDQQPRWFRFVRRGFGVLPLLAAIVAMPFSARHGIWDTWVGMLCLRSQLDSCCGFSSIERPGLLKKRSQTPTRRLIRTATWFGATAGLFVRRSRYPSLFSYCC